MENEKENSETDRYLNSLGAIAEETGTTFLLIHHTRKQKGEENTDVRGAQAINQNAGITVVVRKMEKGAENARLLTSIRRYDETPDTLVVAREGDGYRVIGTEAEALDAEREDKILGALQGIPEGLTVAQIGEATELKDGMVRKTCAGLGNGNRLIKLGEDGKADPFRYRLPEEESSFFIPGGIRERTKQPVSDDPEDRYAEFFGPTGTEG